MSTVRRKYEGALGEVELPCDLLHLVVREAGRVGQDCQRIPAEPCLGEDVTRVVAVVEDAFLGARFAAYGARRPMCPCPHAASGRRTSSPGPRATTVGVDPPRSGEPPAAWARTSRLLLNARPFGLEAKPLIYRYSVDRRVNHQRYLASAGQQVGLGTAPERTGDTSSLTGPGHEKMQKVLAVSDAKHPNQLALNHRDQIAISFTANVPPDRLGRKASQKLRWCRVRGRRGAMMQLRVDQRADVRCVRLDGRTNCEAGAIYHDYRRAQ